MPTDPELETFGPNTWLIEELYRRYAEDPNSVSPTWQDFFKDYRPSGNGQAGVAPSPPATIAPSPAPPDALALRGPAARVVENMEARLAIPTATSARVIPAKLLDQNRRI